MSKTMTSPSKTETSCRICSCTELDHVLSLGKTPLANSLLKSLSESEQEQRFPLELVRCRNCSLVQITETVNPEILFSHYVYFSSFADTTIASAELLVKRLVAMRKLGPESLAAEIASNDGYLLQF